MVPKNGRSGRAGPQSGLPVMRVAIDPDVADISVGEVLRQRPGQRAHGAVTPVNGRLDRLDPKLESVARLGALHGDRPGQDMRSDALQLGVVDGLQGGWDDEALAWRRHHLGPARHAFEDHRIAGGDGENGRECGVEHAEADRVGP